jgi:hypothetical protein
VRSLHVGHAVPFSAVGVKWNAENSCKGGSGRSHADPVSRISLLGSPRVAYDLGSFSLTHS